MRGNRDIFSGKKYIQQRDYYLTRTGFVNACNTK